MSESIEVCRRLTIKEPLKLGWICILFFCLFFFYSLTDEKIFILYSVFLKMIMSRGQTWYVVQDILLCQGTSAVLIWWWTFNPLLRDVIAPKMYHFNQITAVWVQLLETFWCYFVPPWNNSNNWTCISADAENQYNISAITNALWTIAIICAPAQVKY